MKAESCLDHKMEGEDQSYCTKTLLELVLEIVYLLTGEDYDIVIKTPVQQMPYSDCQHGASPISVPPPYSQKPEVKHKKQKILEVTMKMMELLTGEVPIRCQDVTVYFSMKEWEYLEGHKELYKDAMMASQPALTSPDGSGNGNPPERCPRPLYSPHHPTQEGVSYGRHHQSRNLEDYTFIIKEEHNEEDEEYGVMKEPSEECKNVMMEPPSKKNPPERCPRPLYSHRDPTLEDLTIPHHHQEDLTTIPQHKPYLVNAKVEVKQEEEEEMIMRGEPKVGVMITVKEKTSLDINTADGRCSPTRKVHTENQILPYSAKHNQIAQSFQEANLIRHNTPHRLRPSGTSMEPPNPTPSPDQSPNIVSDLDLTPQSVDRAIDTSDLYEFPLPRDCKCERPFSCAACKRTFSCPECGKRFAEKGRLQNHQMIHTGELPYACSECGKCFHLKNVLVRHQKIHTERLSSCLPRERPFSCPECGKRFADEGSLQTHQGIHMDKLPYACSECGKRFHLKNILVRHQKIHAERPFSCSECGKRYIERSKLLIHQRIHTGERPYPCSECGKCFTENGKLARHLQTHSSERPYACSKCTKRFARKGCLKQHQLTHSRQGRFSCLQCGKCFTKEAYFTLHQRTHN